MQPRNSKTFQVVTKRDLATLPHLAGLPEEERLAMQAVAEVLPFRVNRYVIDELIDWDRIPEDPIFQLTFPQPGMLTTRDRAHMVDLLRRGASHDGLAAAALEIRRRLNPHPAGQKTLNVPRLDGRALPGLQHKYAETVLFFPSQGQTCHAYCTYCFRWPQFVGLDEERFAASETDDLIGYLRAHPEVSNVLITGGDPLVMRTTLLRRYVEPLLAADLPNLRSIRIGSKALAYWPHRFLGDRDADDLMRLFEEIVAAGKHLAVMAHYSHPRELSTPSSQAALARVRATGATVRCQAPLIRHVNDDADAWAQLWRDEVRHGAVPYYMFIERDTGAQHYFAVPLARALDIFNDAYRQVSGLARTVRGPSMSTTPGKITIDGVAQVGRRKAFVLRFLQARNPEWVRQPFFARFDPNASWLHDLVPLDGGRFFFEQGRGWRDQLRVLDGQEQPVMGAS